MRPLFIFTGLLTEARFRHDDSLTRQIPVSKGSLFEGPELWQGKGPSGAPNAASEEINTRSTHQREEGWWQRRVPPVWMVGLPHGEWSHSPLLAVCSRTTTGSLVLWTEEALGRYLLNESHTCRCSGKPERGERLSTQTRDCELVDGVWLQSLVMLSGSRAEAQRGISIGEKSAQARGLVLSLSPNCLDQRVLRFRMDVLRISKYSPASLGEWGCLSHHGCQFCSGDNEVFADLTQEV